jgi:osmotically-inducible protein OsmY
MRTPFCAVAFVAILTGTLSGCALYHTYEECGLHGCPGDAQITAAVLSRFSQQPDLEPNVVYVQTLDHVVYLRGLVSSGLEIDTAESLARSVPGVKSVVSSIGVSTAGW